MIVEVKCSFIETRLPAGCHSVLRSGTAAISCIGSCVAATALTDAETADYLCAQTQVANPSAWLRLGEDEWHRQRPGMKLPAELSSTPLNAAAFGHYPCRCHLILHEVRVVVEAAAQQVHTAEVAVAHAGAVHTP